MEEITYDVTGKGLDAKAGIELMSEINRLKSDFNYGFITSLEYLNLLMDVLDKAGPHGEYQEIRCEIFCRCLDIANTITFKIEL